MQVIRLSNSTLTSVQKTNKAKATKCNRVVTQEKLRKSNREGYEKVLVYTYYPYPNCKIICRIVVIFASTLNRQVDYQIRIRPVCKRLTKQWQQNAIELSRKKNVENLSEKAAKTAFLGLPGALYIYSLYHSIYWDSKLLASLML